MLSRLSRQTLLFLLLCCYIIGLFLQGVTPLPLSISSILLTLLGIYILIKDKKRITAESWLLISGFLVLLVSAFASENLKYFGERLQVKLPLLFLGLAISAIQLSQDDILRLLKLYLACTFLMASGVYIHYLANKSSIDAAYLMAQVMPTPINHIRFSLMLAMACYAGYYILSRQGYKSAIEKYFCLLITFALVIFCHIYSVRSGLIALYCITLMLLLKHIFIRRKYLQGLAIGIALMAMLLFMQRFSTTFRNKITNTVEDIRVYRNKSYANYYSISTRLMSYEIAWDIFTEHPLLGCGLGDIKDETDRRFKAQHPEITTPILPHNQFLFYLAATGIVGLLAFMITFFGPLLVHRNYRNELLLAHYLLLFTAFQTEPMMETQLGMAYCMLFLLMGFNRNASLPVELPKQPVL